jgi:hypothetical protein
MRRVPGIWTLTESLRMGSGMPQGLTTDGLKALDTALARHVDQGDLPGLVALVARGNDVHVAVLSTSASTPHRAGR